MLLFIYCHHLLLFPIFHLYNLRLQISAVAALWNEQLGQFPLKLQIYPGSTANVCRLNGRASIYIELPMQECYTIVIHTTFQFPLI